MAHRRALQQWFGSDIRPNLQGCFLNVPAYAMTTACQVLGEGRDY